MVCDPYGDVGYVMPQVCADAVTVSHRHYDHDNTAAVGGNPTVIDAENVRSLPGVEISAVKSFHDGQRGKTRGENVIFKFRMDGIDVCHLGGLGEACTAELIDSILPVNVLLIPVGGNYTIDAEMAKEYVDRIMPDIVIPMHYRTKGCNLDIDKAEKFLCLFDGDNVSETDGSSLELMRSDLIDGETKVVVLKRR